MPQPTVSQPALIPSQRFAGRSDRSRIAGIAPRPSQLAFDDQLSLAGAKVRSTLYACHQTLSAKSNAPPVSKRGAHSRGISGCVSRQIGNYFVELREIVIEPVLHGVPQRRIAVLRDLLADQIHNDSRL